MQLTVFHMAIVAASAGCLALGTAPGAAAELPAVPSPPPYVPGGVEVLPGSFSYPYFVIIVPPPASVDARGVNISSNVDPGQSTAGMPGSRLGNSPPPPNALTNASALYGISGGALPPQTPNGGVNISAGIQAAGLENLYGEPPSSAPTPEAAMPTNLPGNPPPMLEDPRGRAPLGAN